MNWLDKFKLSLDITAGVGTAFLLAIVGSFIAFLLGVSTLRKAGKMIYFRKRQAMVSRGWRFILIALLLAASSFFLNRYAETAIYSIFPPTPTITETATITLTPTISQTPTLSATPTITETPSITNTPAMPAEIRASQTSEVIASVDFVMSPIQFTSQLGENGLPAETLTIFENPIPQVIAFFSYDKLSLGTQLSFLWYRSDDMQLVCSNTRLMELSTGGYSYDTCAPDDPNIWLPGDYEVQIFTGTEWFSSAYFKVAGMPLTSTPTRTLSPTITPTKTKTATSTPLPSATATDTRTPTITPTPTITHTSTVTRTPSITPTPTKTKTSTVTPSLTPTRTSSPTVTNTFTPTNTRTPRPTDTRIPTITLTVTPTLIPTKTLRPTDTLRPTLTQEAKK